MIAVSPFEPRRPRWAPRAWVILLSVLLAWTPWALVWGDPFRAAVGQGQAAAGVARQAAPVQDSTLTPLPGWQPGTGGASEIDLNSLYGQDAATIAAGQQQQSTLLQEQSPYGDAYRAVFSGIDRPRPDMNNDPLWRGTDAVLDNLADITRTFADCQEVVHFRQTQREVHLPDDHYCQRLPDRNARCELRHDYAWPQAVIPFTNTGQRAACEEEDCAGHCPLKTCATHGHEAPECQDWMERWAIESAWAQAQQACLQRCQQRNTHLQQRRAQYPNAECLQVTAAGSTVRITLTDRSRIIMIDDRWDATQAQLPGQSSPPPGCVYMGGGWWCPFSTGGQCQWHNGQMWCAWSPSATVGRRLPLTGTMLDQMNSHGQTTFSQPMGAGLWGERAPVNAEVWFHPVSTPATDVWSGTDECIAAAGLIGNRFCTGSRVCEDMPELAPSGCYEAPGIRVCPENMQPAPIAGVNPFCRRVRVTVDCDGFYQGDMTCWSDPDGNERCPENTGGHRTNCEVFEQDPNCAHIRTTCVEGARDNAGNCFVHEEQWDCGSLYGVPVLERQRELNCVGPVRCMGEDCASFEWEQSQDFAQAAAALQALQAIIAEANCDPDSGDCEIFRGQAESCKSAVGGVVNCCQRPSGVSIGDYITLSLAVLKIDTAIMGLQQGNTIRGGWEVLRAPVTETWTAVRTSFSSVANTLTGSVSAASSDAAAQMGVDAFKTQLMGNTAQWAAQVFGDAAVNALFSVAGTGGQAVSNGVVQGPLQLGGGGALVGTALQVAMWAYMIYSVAMILVQMLWTCERREFELGVKRELRSCTKIGTYCNSRVLGICIERRETFCCFNSPLSRIIQEQVRPQIGMHWGVARQPDCRGIRLSQLTTIDWQQVDLTEWLALLAASGNFPTAANLDIEALTGSGSLLAAGGPRENAAERARSRTEGLDAETLRNEAEAEHWTEIRSSVPRP
ncbi:MAG: conjugal transfer protein TraN [Chromatiaceae bacterium]|nr:MAG: conjugal transfer protein TraN [Chromatiaceae bacterium]